MNDFNRTNLNPEIADVLREIGNVGVGQASIALGKMLNMEISISVPHIIEADGQSLPFNDTYDDKVNMGILMKMENTFGGVVLFIIAINFISDMIFKYTGKRLHDKELLEDEDSLSAMQELANIIASCYIKAIGAYTGMRLYLSPAMVGVDDIKSLVSFTISHFNLTSGTVICVDTSLSIREGNAVKGEVGRVVMLPDNASVNKMVKMLGLD